VYYGPHKSQLSCDPISSRQLR